MPLPVIADTFRTAIKWETGGPAYAVNVMHWLDTAGTHDALDLYTALNAHVTANMWKLVSGATSVTEVTIQPLDGTSAGSVFLTGAPTKWSGAGTTDYSPQLAGIVKLSTGLAGRSKRGRLFLPFIAEGTDTGGNFNASDVTAAQTAWDAFLVAMEADDFLLVVASYLHAYQNSVLTVQVESRGATQRRRMSRLR